MLSREQFELLVKEGWRVFLKNLLDKIKNVAILVEDEPSAEVRKRRSRQRRDPRRLRGVPQPSAVKGYGME